MYADRFKVLWALLAVFSPGEHGQEHVKIPESTHKEVHLEIAPCEKHTGSILGEKVGECCEGPRCANIAVDADVKGQQQAEGDIKIDERFTNGKSKSNSAGAGGTIPTVNYDDLKILEVKETPIQTAEYIGWIAFTIAAPMLFLLWLTSKWKDDP